MRNVMIGCGIAVSVCVALSVIGVALLAPKLTPWRTMLQDQIAKEEDRQQLSNEWVPPAKDAKDPQALQEIPDDTLFPQTVGNDKRTGADEKATVPALSIKLTGKHATYQVGSDSVDVYVYVATESEKQAIFNYIKALSESRNGTRYYTNLGYRVYYDSTESGQNHLWSMRNGWLFVFRTNATEDKEEFVLAYLRAIDSKGTVTPSEGTKPQDPNKDGVK